VEDPRLNHLPWPDVSPRKFQIQDYHVHFRGRCDRCRQTPAGSRHDTIATPISRGLRGKTKPRSKQGVK
jgi:hypothetical protein